MYLVKSRVTAPLTNENSNNYKLLINYFFVQQFHSGTSHFKTIDALNSEQNQQASHSKYSIFECKNTDFFLYLLLGSYYFSHAIKSYMSRCMLYTHIFLICNYNLFSLCNGICMYVFWADKNLKESKEG